ncbi:MAG: META domain-containing protein [Flavobacteriaceae bacterium]|nr:META domain-containing protein [Flavobacteriaceae bacterium]
MKHLVILLAILLNTECGSKKETTTSEENTLNTENTIAQSKLEGRWSITSIGNRVISGNDKAVISISRNQLSASVGCNNHTGSFEINKGTIKIYRLIATEMFCMELDEIEREMGTQLQKTTQYLLDNESLLLKDSEGSTTFVLRKNS